MAPLDYLKLQVSGTGWDRSNLTKGVPLVTGSVSVCHYP